MDCRDRPTAVRLKKIGCRSGPAGLVRVFAIGFLEAASALWPGEREGIAAIYASAGPTATLFASMIARVASPALSTNLNRTAVGLTRGDRKSSVSGKSVSVRVELGG